MNSASALDDTTTEKARFLPLADNYPKLAALSSALGWGFALLVMLASAFFLDKVILPVFMLPVFTLLATLSILFSYFAAKARAYHRGEFELMYKSGLWWKNQTAVSFSRIQHIDLAHGPLERKFGLATLNFFTAGGAKSDLSIPGLRKADAEQIREQILTYAQAEYQSSHE
ncbi:MAG: PH domain-containing protein [Proteobacteria bacterium]|nr:PH domain-containing protein [Pseudomonadota bacterium]